MKCSSGEFINIFNLYNMRYEKAAEFGRGFSLVFLSP